MTTNPTDTDEELRQEMYVLANKAFLEHGILITGSSNMVGGAIKQFVDSLLPTFHSHLTKELAKQNSHEHDLKATQCDPDCKCDLIHLYCSKCSYIDVADGWEGCNSSLDEKLAKRDIDTMKEWNDMLDRAANGEVVKLTRNGIELTINSLDGMHDGMSRVVNTAMALGAEIEKRNNPNPKTLTHKHNKENK